jgi:hypothetical protein
MAYKVLQLRRDTAANWTSNDPTLASGEIGVETDTLKFKIGDGTTAWTSLGYASVPVSDFDEAAQDAIGAMIADTNSIDITYTDGTPELKADVKISASPGDVTLSIEADGLKADIDAIDLGSSV